MCKQNVSLQSVLDTDGRAEGSITEELESESPENL